MIRGRITVQKWEVKDTRVAAALASQPSIRGALVALAEQVADGAQQRFATASQPRPVDHQRFLGRYWSASPTAVAAQVKVKDLKDFPVATSRVPRVAPVALVVADHPYSITYERGHDEFPQINAMSAALTAVANRSSGVSRRPA